MKATIKYIISKLFKFIFDLFSDNSTVSSKRFTGVTCILSSIFLISYSIVNRLDLKPFEVVLIKLLFSSGLALLGVTVAEKYVKRK